MPGPRNGTKTFGGTYPNVGLSSVVTGEESLRLRLPDQLDGELPEPLGTKDDVPVAPCHLPPATCHLLAADAVPEPTATGVVEVLEHRGQAIQRAGEAGLGGPAGLELVPESPQLQPLLATAAAS
jgi:hypothetical protein